MQDDFPINAVIPSVRQALIKDNTVILQAPPGAGKSTVLPLALLDLPLLSGKKILMLEPRRLAARAVSWRLAEQLGEIPGQTCGYRIRFESKVSINTRIEVVTEGILTLGQTVEFAIGATDVNPRHQPVADHHQGSNRPADGDYAVLSDLRGEDLRLERDEKHEGVKRHQHDE